MTTETTAANEAFTPDWELDNLCSDRQLVNVETLPEFVSRAKTIRDDAFQPQVGCCLHITTGPTPWSGDWRSVELEACDWWDGADFAVKVPPPVGSVATRVEITGRTLRYFDGSTWLRVRITWPGDGEPDTHTSGWLLADGRTRLPLAA